ncbi:MAG: hypothetical protein RL220_882 [Bacteroidota bacterium]
MSSSDLSAFDASGLPDVSNYRVGIVVSEWNSEVTENLLRGCTETLSTCGFRLDNIHIYHVPGSFELPLGASWLLENRQVHGVICLGAVVRGETPHFEFVSLACANGIQDVALKYNKPVVFGVLTTDTAAQAYDRSGGRLGNKGVEAAVTVIKMLGLQRQLDESWVGVK